MIEKKYYVYDIFDSGNILIDFNRNLDVDWILEEYVRHNEEDMKCCEFTKSELAKIKDGALYRPDTSNPVLDHDLDFLNNLEWINPMIKLVPVEELKKYG